MYKTSLATGASANWGTLRALWLDKPGIDEAAYARDPCVVRVVELLQCFFGSARVDEPSRRSSAAAELGAVHHREAFDQVPKPPGDGAHRLRVVRRRAVVSGELARPERHRCGALAAAADRLTAGNRLPDVLVVR